MKQALLYVLLAIPLIVAVALGVEFLVQVSPLLAKFVLAFLAIWVIFGYRKKE